MRGLWVMLLAVFVFAGCLQKPVEEAKEPVEDGVMEDAVHHAALSWEYSLALSGDINRFAFDLYSGLKEEGENIFFSPLSVSCAFGLAYIGAERDTAEEMYRVLRYSIPERQVASAYMGLLDSLNEREKEDVFELHVANAIWMQENYPVKREYTDSADMFFRALAERLDFSHAEKAAEKINAWVSEQTAGKIRDLISPDAIDQLTRLVLTNAVYFRGAWERQFEEAHTRPRGFFITGEETVEVPMMHITQEFNYAEGEGFKALEMPYKDSGLSMLVLLPEEAGGLSALEEKLGAGFIDSVSDALERRRVNVGFPRFKVETRYGIADAMQALGMEKAFDHALADFSGISEEGDLHIKEAVHKAYIDVTEEGTEAAAATGLVVGVTSAPLEPAAEFIADRPFVFVIRDTRTGLLLFVGSVSDPSTD